MAWLRKLQHPFVTAILVTLLVAMTFSLPRYDVGTQSTVARLAKTPGPGVQLRGLVPGMPTPFVAKKSSSGWQVSDPQTESWDFASRVMDGQVNDAFVFTYSASTQVESGFFALTRRETFESLTIWPEQSEAANAERRAVALQYLVTHGQPQVVATRLKDGNIFKSTFIIGGYLYNAAAIAASVLLMWSLAWIFKVPSWLGSRRAGSRISRGECPTCAYSTKSLGGAPCPECGSTQTTPADNSDSAGKNTL